MNAFVIDAFEYSRLKQSGQGEIAISDLPRLSEELVDASGVLHWALQGGVNAIGHPQLRLSVLGAVRLMCQRCLMPFDFNVKSKSILVLAKDEACADEIDALLDDDEIEVIVGQKALNVIELIEDEALLRMPLSPRHDVCPGSVIQDVLSNEEKKASPFAVLKNVNQ